MKRLPKVLWVILAVFAFANGLEALRYLLPHVPFPAELDNLIHRRVALSLHAMGGAIALMAGPLQFLPRFRESNWNRHRPLGWIYCGGVLLGCCAAVWSAPHSQTGWIAAWRVAVLDSERGRGGDVPAVRADAIGDKCASEFGQRPPELS